MTIESKLSILDKYKNISLNSPKVSESYWIEDHELCLGLNEENEQLRKSIQMTDSKFRRKFDL